MRFDDNPFTSLCEKERKRKKRLKGFKFRTFVVVFKWHHGSEGVTLLYVSEIFL